jgi:hypothetical protein
MRVLFEYQRGRSADDPDSRPCPGGIVWIQRFSDGAGAWLHLHILMPDGVFRAPKNALGAVFEPHGPPAQAEANGLAKTLARRISKLMTKYANSAPDDALLERCAAHSAKRVRVPTPAPSHTKRPALLGGGVTEFLFEPVAFLARIASLIPRPKTNQILRRLLYRLIPSRNRPPRASRRHAHASRRSRAAEAHDMGGARQGAPHLA